MLVEIQESETWGEVSGHGRQEREGGREGGGCGGKEGGEKF